MFMNCGGMKAVWWDEKRKKKNKEEKCYYLKHSIIITYLCYSVVISWNDDETKILKLTPLRKYPNECWL